MTESNLQRKIMRSKFLKAVGGIILVLILYGTCIMRDISSDKSYTKVSLSRTRKSVLVTGGAGFIGHHIITRLRQYNVSVIGIDNFNHYYDVNLKYKRSNLSRLVRHVDVCDRVKLIEIITDYAITHVVHMAAQAGVRYSRSHPQAYVKSNVECFVELLEILKRRSIPLIYASSSSVYGQNTKVPFSESDRVDLPASLYAATKRENELLARVYWNIYKLRSIGLRFFTVYGPLGRPDMAYYSFTKNISEGNPISVFNNGDLSRDFTYIDDIVDGVVNTLDIPFDCEILNLGRGQPQQLMTFIHAIEKEVGKRANINFKEMSKGDVFKTYADVSKARGLLGYYPKVALKDGIAKFVAWYKSANI
ncbi:uncharacterized protein LOC127712522 [Mytilus californianus]|uniref:uncharacterized protein LOC127712522 n=1 Tax=Mytilus californianus TaxID=6549 RepID=UPI002247511D|nr:uncharacterized protein LOC127712522 [Mytilus californianus]XP_052074968.1 uncharacterized protein LOC127712522 [Mytilus californianus]XP_052074969.1 uncharacterized protein LOC127712522 [Mytilus californianus]